MIECVGNEKIQREKQAPAGFELKRSKLRSLWINHFATNAARLFTLLMHLPFLHWNWSSPHSSCGMLQLGTTELSSSAPSTQSGSPSQTHFLEMHIARPHSLLALHSNSVSESQVRASVREEHLHVSHLFFPLVLVKFQSSDTLTYLSPI